MISYSILTHNEDESLYILLNLLCQYINENDEIVILDDFSTNPKTFEIVNYFREKLDKKLIFSQRKLNGHFGNQKNHLNSLCSKKWIFNLDADETPSILLLENIKNLLEKDEFDLYYVPRQNIINGISKKDLEKLNFKIDEYNRINWPDYQGRIYLNNKEIYWEGAVHETQKGFKKPGFIKYSNCDLCIIHIKTIMEQYKIKY